MACGPRGAEQLTFPQWQRGGYTAGFAQIDSRIFDSYAASVKDMEKNGEFGSDERFGELVQAAAQWDAASSDDDVIREKAEVFVYHMYRTRTRKRISIRSFHDFVSFFPWQV